MESVFTMYVVVVCCLLVSATISKAQVPLYIFGDSLYDGGFTLYDGIQGDSADSSPYGMTYFKKPAGRFSDGRVIPDFIAEFAGLPLPSPYTLPGLNDFTKGVTFASAGACVLVYLRPNTVTLKLQVDYFRQMTETLNNQVGETKAKNLLAKAVFLFNIAGNDYVTLLQNNMKNLPLPATYKQAFMDKVLGNLTHHLRTIYKLGGRKFAFQGIGPLGCLPAEKNRFSSSGGCVDPPNELAKMHNAALVNTLKNLQTQWPGMLYTVADTYTNAYNRVSNGNRYGFNNVGEACCGTGTFNGLFTCAKKGTNFTVCSDPSTHLFFDAGHFCEKANRQLATEFWAGGTDMVAPYNLQQFFKM